MPHSHTKTEYREYIASEKWQKRRKAYLSWANSCERCCLPRWLAIVAYDQDLHVHHKSYGSIGSEPDEDLEPLCRRCHEIETFGKSYLHRPKLYECEICQDETFDGESKLCDFCRVFYFCQISGRTLFNSQTGVGDSFFNHALEAVWGYLNHLRGTDAVIENIRELRDNLRTAEIEDDE